MNIFAPYPSVGWLDRQRYKYGWLDKALDAWDSLAESFEALLSNVTNSFFILDHAGHILFLLIVLTIAGSVLGIFLFKRRGSGGGPVMTAPANAKEALKAAKQSMEIGNYAKAGEFFEQAGKYNKAIEAYMDGKAFAKAARVHYKHFNNPEKALQLLRQYKLFDQAGALMLEMGDTLEAAKFFKQGGKQQTAAETFEKAGELKEAADLYKNLKRPQDAARCYAKVGAFIPAGEMYEVLFNQFHSAVKGAPGPQDRPKYEDLAKKAAYNLKQGGEVLRAADILLKAKLEKYAAELYASCGESKKAADLFAEAGETRRAAELYNKMGDKKSAAELMAQACQAEGKNRDAAKFHVMAENYLVAADLMAGEYEYEKAAELYLKGGDSCTASEMYMAAGKADKAVQVFVQIGDMEAALRMAEETGDERAMSMIYQKVGRNYEAGLQCLEQGNLGEAEKLLSKVREDNAHFAEAQQKLGEILIQKGDFQGAADKLQMVANRMPPTNLDFFYTLAYAYERTEQLMYAYQLYQTIYAYNYAYKDVAMRMNTLYQQIQSGQSAAATMVAGGGKGRIIGERYELQDELGRGGMGVVYKAKDKRLDRMVAFKVLSENLKSNEQMIKSFESEAMSLAKLTHPYIVSIYDYGEEGGVYFIIMEYVAGKDLKEILKTRKVIPIKGAIQIYMMLCQAMAKANELSIVHRDIKPANIMWTKDNTIKVMDFGLAKVMDKMRGGRTVVAGTPYYMPPEQTLGRNVDHRSDIYAMGVTMYELMTGTVPFKEGDIGYHHIHTQPERPSMINNQIPPAIEQIILKCMAKTQEERYQTAQDVYNALAEATRGGQ